MKSYRAWINQSFSRRISVFFIPVILILLVTVGGVSYYIYYSSILKETEQNIIGIVEQRNYTADLYFQDVKTTIVTLVDNDDITYMLKNYQDMSVVDKFYRQERIDELLMNTSLVREHILDCIIVGKNGYQTNMPDRYNLRSDVDILDEKWFQPYLTKEPRKFYFTFSHENDYYFTQNGGVKSAISVIFPLGNKENRLGYIIVDMDFQKIKELISVNSRTKSLQFVVADENGNIVFADEENEIKTKLPKDAYEQMKKSKTFQFTQNGEKYFGVHQKSDSTGWELMGIMPKRVLIQPAIKLLKILCFIIFPCFVLITILVSAKISRKIKAPLEEIVRQTERVDINCPEPFHVTDSVAEVEHLANKITEMIERMNHLVQLAYVAEMKKKDAQIEALISQINPHFLYNTLQLIKTEAVIGKPGQVAGTVNCLSKFLRYTINNQELYVTLQDELVHIGYYLEIYKRRFPNQYELEIEADDEVRQLKVPKLILQPIVENAVKHGLRQKEGMGRIRISAKIEEDLLIYVEDNGLGMEKTEADNILKNLSIPTKDTGSHVGLKNINERIKLNDGEGYGIVRIETEKNQYFRVYLKIRKGQEDV